ncbi:MAG: NADP oxidoreductase [Acidobacteriota bacterium]
MKKLRLATVWLDGCSGCHMSFLDMDERILALAEKFEVVYSPLVDAKEFPEGVDVALIEGAVASDEDRAKLRLIRERTKTLVSMGDCAITANVPGMRNAFGVKAVLERGYGRADAVTGVPALLARAVPAHEVVAVDAFIPGCPPSAETIEFALAELAAGRVPEMAMRSRFGA